MNLDLDHSLAKVLATDDLGIDQTGLTWSGRSKIKDSGRRAKAGPAAPFFSTAAARPARSEYTATVS